MNKKLDNYSRVKKLLFFAKETFLSDKGMEIMPSLESVEVFRKELTIIDKMVDELIDDLYRKSKD